MTTSNYGCNNLPARDPDLTYPAQDGWLYEQGAGTTLTRLPVMKRQLNRNTIPCCYDRSAADKECDGCWQKKQPPSQVDPSMALPSTPTDDQDFREVAA